MQDFIEQAAARLGVGKEQVAAATGGLLGFIKEHADGVDAGEMLRKLPGAQALIDKAGDGGGGGGLLGGLGDAVGGLLGGGAQQALGVGDLLSKLGLDADKLPDFMELFAKYVKPLLGGDLLKRLAAKVPGLGDLLG